MTLTLIIISCTYTFLIVAFYRGIDAVPETIHRHTNTPTTHFSVLIPFRNEATYLPNLLVSLANLNYPRARFEVLFIDDASTDTSLEIVQTFSKTSGLDIKIISNIHCTNSPKKDAINLAIQHAKYPWIVTTDADVILPTNWLKIFDQYIQNHPSKLLVGPVKYISTPGWLANFQALDQLSLQASTLGGFGIQHPFLCSGANLCYEKKSFLEIHPYKQNSHIASGDDIFLLHQFKKHFPQQVHFVKSTEVLVHTYPENTWKDLIQQRLRWAAKTNLVHHNFTNLVGTFVIGANAAWIISLFLLFTQHWVIGLVFLGIKYSIDYLLLAKTAKIWKHHFSGITYILSALFYPFFIFYIGFLSLFSTYTWKGAIYKK
ncbi:glycosyltransferase [Flavobacteriaceae bacterium F08102]|nr:glycosyltransferase [Flavobacteriaceae bacterium F08102]